jgi:hypothetical protein
MMRQSHYNSKNPQESSGRPKKEMTKAQLGALIQQMYTRDS